MGWQNVQRKIRLALQESKIVLVPSAVVTLVVLGARFSGALQTVELFLFDTFTQFSLPESTDPRIVIVAVDEPTIQAAGNYPLSDRQLLDLLQKIQAQQPHSIAIDLFRDLPIEPGTEEFQEFVATQDNLFAIEKVLYPEVAPPLGFPQERIGFTDTFLDSDGIQRRTILGTTTDKGFRFSLVMLLALDYLEQYGLSLDNGDRDDTAMKLGETEIPRFYARTGGYSNQQFHDGAIENIIYFRRAKKPFLHYSATDILNSQLPPNALENRIVFIGATSPSIPDYFNAPVTSSINLDQQVTYGVELQAHALSQILNAVLGSSVLSSNRQIGCY